MSARWNASSGTSAPPCNPSSPMRPFLISLLLALSSSAMAACPALLDRKMQTLDERTQPLCDYAGKVLLVVNTASQCGYTPQYDGLEALYRKYRDRGLVVLGFPMNDYWRRSNETVDRRSNACARHERRARPGQEGQGALGGAEEAAGAHEGLQRPRR